MSDIARPNQPVPLADMAPPKGDATPGRYQLRDTGFFSMAEIQRALAASKPAAPPRGEEPAQGC